MTEIEIENDEFEIDIRPAPLTDAQIALLATVQEKWHMNSPVPMVYQFTHLNYFTFTCQVTIIGNGTGMTTSMNMQCVPGLDGPGVPGTLALDAKPILDFVASLVY